MCVSVIQVVCTWWPSPYSLVVGDVQVEASDMRGVSGEHDVASELTRCEPERKVWNVVQLKLGVYPEGRVTKWGGERTNKTGSEADVML